jgi:HD-GYP domain-containing protein (c-di-GMP phosphodiesterase class II)
MEENYILKYWGLIEKPFENNNNLKFYYNSSEFEKLNTTLLTEIKTKNRIFLLSGEKGVGKSYYCESIIPKLQQEKFKIVYIPSGSYTGAKLMQKILYQLKPKIYFPDDHEELCGIFTQFLVTNQKQDKNNILIIMDDIDSTKELDYYGECFWRIIKLTVKENSFLKLMLVGESSLIKKIQKSFILTPPFSQYYLNPLDEEETIKYIAHRLKIIDADIEKIFSSDVFNQIYKYSHGLPKKINDVCTIAMKQGADSESKIIDMKIVNESINIIKSKIELKQPIMEKVITKLFKEDIKDVIDSDPSKILYNEAISAAKKMFSLEGEKVYLIDITGIRDIIERLIDIIETGNEKIVDMSKKTIIDEKNYLPYHSVNVCILSIKVGLTCGYNKQQLCELAISAFLHDIGMIDNSEIIKKPDKLNYDEYIIIRKHPSKGSEILQKLKTYYSDETINPETIYEHHERIDGTGYPNGIKGKENINEYAKIIGIVDVYEALTHLRPHRKEFSPLKAIQTILEMNDDKFDMTLLNSFIKALNFYLPGTIVKLNTGETGKVIEVNEIFPSKPKLEIISETASKYKIIDLSKSADIYITEIIDTAIKL